MKPWHAIIGMVGILILVCAPVVANSLIPMHYESGMIREPTEPRFGTLSIDSYPSGANVYLDEQYKGTTPLTISGLSPHSYHIALTMEGYRTYVARVSISNGKTSTVSATLTPTLAQILPSGYVSSNSKYLPTPTPPFISPWGPRSAVDVYLMLKASDLDAILTSLFS